MNLPFWRHVLRISWRNKPFLPCLLFLLMLFTATLLAPQMTHYRPDQIDLSAQFAPASWTHLLGADENGRDVLTRLIFGARASLLVGLVSAAISAGIGVLFGITAGYFGRYVDALIMRVTDGFMSIPLFFLLLTILTLFGSNLTNVVIVIGLTSWMRVARMVRSEVLKQRAMDYVLAARAIGAKDQGILWRHILPHTLPVTAVATTLNIAFAILTESALSFLGLGVQPPTPSWGNMLASSQTYLWTAPQLAIYPGLLILLTVLSFNALGDGVLDLMDPRTRWVPQSETPTKVGRQAEPATRQEVATETP
ncbi:MAG: ABC transporter permease [Ardenticatenaceae bacterium]|nr:ABC transporter permease [Ardenticatenaceae bacterium]